MQIRCSECGPSLHGPAINGKKRRGEATCIAISVDGIVNSTTLNGGNKLHSMDTGLFHPYCISETVRCTLFDFQNYPSASPVAIPTEVRFFLDRTRMAVFANSHHLLLLHEQSLQFQSEAVFILPCLVLPSIH